MRPPATAPAAAPPAALLFRFRPCSAGDMGDRLRPWELRMARDPVACLDRFAETSAGLRLLPWFEPPLARGLEWSTSQVLP